MCSMTATKLEMYVFVCLDVAVLPHNLICDLCSAITSIHLDACVRVCAKFGNGACMLVIYSVLRIPQTVFEPLFYPILFVFLVTIGISYMGSVSARHPIQAPGLCNSGTLCQPPSMLKISQYKLIVMSGLKPVPPQRP